MTGRPAAFSALAFASTARVADSDMADTRADILVVGMLPWCHLRRGDAQLVSPRAEPSARARAKRSRGYGGRPPGRYPRKFGPDTMAVFAIGPELTRLVRRRGYLRHTLWWLQP